MKIESSLEQITESLERLVFDGDEPIVFAITGGWGEGKTYFWRNTILPKFAVHNPGYVSVFGADDIASIRQRVLVAAGKNLASRDDAESTSDETPNVVHASTILSSVLKKVSDKIGMPDALVEQLMEKYALEEGWVLCIDDIERLSVDVGTDTFLGYVNELREEHKLKVVLIFNDNWFAENDDTSFAQYREKVIDYEVPFFPDLNEIVRYVATDDYTSGGQVRAEIVEHCKTLNLRNIRVIGKAVRYFNEVVSVLPENPNVDFLSHTLRSLILFSWIKFSSDATIQFEHLKKFSSFTASITRIMQERDGVVDDDQVEASHAEKLLEKYGHLYTDDLDVVLLHLVRSGLLINGELLEEYEKHVAETSKGKLYDDYHQTWQTMFHGTFRDNTDEFCKELVAKSASYIANMSVEPIDTVLDKLERLGYSEEAETLFNLFIDEHPNFYEEYLAASQRSDPLRYPAMIDAVGEAKIEFEKDYRKLPELLEEIWDTDYMRKNDHAQLATFSADEIVDYLLNNDQEKLTRKVLSLFQFTRTFSSDDEIENNKTIDQVVNVLAEKNVIGELRLRSMGLPPREAEPAIN